MSRAEFKQKLADLEAIDEARGNFLREAVAAGDVGEFRAILADKEKEIRDMRAKHAQELAAVRAKHAQELAAVRAEERATFEGFVMTLRGAAPAPPPAAAAK